MDGYKTLVLRGPNLSIQPFDLFSAFLGTEFEFRLARVTLGAGYGWGNAPADRITDLIGDEDIDAQYVGLPPTWRWSIGAAVGTHRRDGNDLAMYFNGGFYRDLMSPVMNAFGVIGEGYGGRRGSFEDFGDGWDGGLRAGLFTPAGRLAFGWDYNFKDSEADFFLSLIHPLQRGGIFTNGGALRIDYLPGRSHSTSVGVHLPIGQRW